MGKLELTDLDKDISRKTLEDIMELIHKQMMTFGDEYPDSGKLVMTLSVALSRANYEMLKQVGIPHEMIKDMYLFALDEEKQQREKDEQE